MPYLGKNKIKFGLILLHPQKYALPYTYITSWQGFQLQGTSCHQPLLPAAKFTRFVTPLRKCICTATDVGNSTRTPKQSSVVPTKSHGWM